MGRVASCYPNNPYFLHEKVILEFQKVTTPNDLHHSIIKLFRKQCRIVTTNFDTLFIEVIKEKNLNIKEYFAPALTLVEDFEGI